MTPGLDVVAQFEPDFDGSWDGDGDAPAREADEADATWIVWADATLESAWASSELAAEWLAAMRLTTR